MVNFRRLLVFLCLLSLCFAQPKPRKCPDTPIRTADSKVIKVSQYRGKVVMVVMFLTSCQECVVMLQFSEKLQKEYASRGFQVLAISLDESSANLLPFQQRYRFSFPLGHVEKEGAIELAALKKDAHPLVPLVMFIDWMGNVRFKYEGGNDPIFQQGEKGIRGIATGLLNQAAAKEGPQYKSAPAPAKQ
jgi:peroxiredoxin